MLLAALDRSGWIPEDNPIFYDCSNRMTERTNHIWGSAIFTAQISLGCCLMRCGLSNIYPFYSQRPYPWSMLPLRTLPPDHKFPWSGRAWCWYLRPYHVTAHIWSSGPYPVREMILLHRAVQTPHCRCGWYIPSVHPCPDLRIFDRRGVWLQVPIIVEGHLFPLYWIL